MVVTYFVIMVLENKRCFNYCRVLRIVLIIVIHVHVVSSVLPEYTCALHANEVRDKENLISNYFSQGYTNNEIGVFLGLQHGIILSVRTIKRILKRMGLKRASVFKRVPS